MKDLGTKDQNDAIVSAARFEKNLPVLILC
jgi:hypothetical protein